MRYNEHQWNLATCRATKPISLSTLLAPCSCRRRHSITVRRGRHQNLHHRSPLLQPPPPPPLSFSSAAPFFFFFFFYTFTTIAWRQTAEFKAAIEQEEILEKIESGIQERNADRSYVNNLLFSIAEALGISTEPSALKKEFEEFKREAENAKLRKDQAEAIQMDQIISLLERADATSSPNEREVRYIAKRDSLGNQPLDPLHSFICPVITKEVMVDPVEISSGHTFERSAIEKWFADGNYLCPLTMVTLDTSILRPNKTLRQSTWQRRGNQIGHGKEDRSIDWWRRLHEEGDRPTDRYHRHRRRPHLH